MSYCRWSSDNFKCDLYVYSDVSGGYTTHVAGRRVVGDVPPVDYQADDWAAARKAQSDFLHSAEHQEIDHPDAGKTFNDADLESLLERLTYLRSEGFCIPDYVFETVREEIEEESET